MYHNLTISDSNNSYNNNKNINTKINDDGIKNKQNIKELARSIF